MEGWKSAGIVGRLHILRKRNFSSVAIFAPEIFDSKKDWKQSGSYIQLYLPDLKQSGSYTQLYLPGGMEG